MRNLLTLFAIALAVMVSSCSKFDDTEIWDKLNEQEETLNDHEKRIAALEELCRQLNTNIAALQTIVEALEKNDYITNVSPVREDGEIVGYTISFANSDTITIYNGRNGVDGTDGKDGYTPQIGVKQASDGYYYWTVDGEWLLDDDGNKIRTTGDDGKGGVSSGNGENGADGKDGITPRLKIEDDYWYVSYDEGATWIELGRATGEDGADGKDGYTPQIGVKQASDGYYYWTVDGEWLLDDDGNEIRTTGDDGKDGVSSGNGENGADGKDGITPRLKIEDDYWYVSYDEGATWIELGRATGEDGADGSDGSDGDSIFSSVTQDEEYVYFELATGETIVINKNNSGNCISFDDAVVKGICIKYWDTNHDGELSFDEAASVTNIGTSFKSVTEINIFNEIKYFTSLTTISDFAFFGERKNRVDVTPAEYYYTYSRLSYLNLPNGIKSIGESAFEECRNLSHIVLSDELTSIGNRAFYGCTALTEITFPETLLTIGDYAFYNCGSIESVIIPDNVTSVGGNAFGYCKQIKTVTIGENVTSIGGSAFYEIRGLMDVYCKPVTPPSGCGIDANATSVRIYVPTESIEAYKSAPGWKNFKSKIVGFDF